MYFKVEICWLHHYIYYTPSPSEKQGLKSARDGKRANPPHPAPIPSITRIKTGGAKRAN